MDLFRPPPFGLINAPNNCEGVTLERKVWLCRHALSTSSNRYPRKDQSEILDSYESRLVTSQTTLVQPESLH